MSGRGLLSEVPSFENASRIKMFSNAWVWTQAYEPVDDPTGQIDSVSNDGSAAMVSPGMSFANRLAYLRSGREIALVPCAKGSSTLANWAKNLSRTTLYGSMIARAKEAEKQGVLKGVIWWQGKNDAVNLTATQAWAANCNQWISDVRSDLGIPDLPVVVVVIDNQEGVTSTPYYVSQMQAQQRSVVGPKIAQVETAGLTMKVGDPVHLGTAGQLIAGVRMAEAMNSIL